MDTTHAGQNAAQPVQHMLLNGHDEEPERLCGPAHPRQAAEAVRHEASWVVARSADEASPDGRMSEMCEDDKT